MEADKIKNAGAETTVTEGGGDGSGKKHGGVNKRPSQLRIHAGKEAGERKNCTGLGSTLTTTRWLSRRRCIEMAEMLGNRQNIIRTKSDDGAQHSRPVTLQLSE